MEIFPSPNDKPVHSKARAVLFPSTVTNSCRAFISTALCAFGLLGEIRQTARADAEIEPPYNLKWGETALRLEEALLGTNAKIVERTKSGGGREVWKVEGLPGIALKRTSFHLCEGKLIEVELQYWKDDWSPATYEEFMRTVLRRLEEKHRAGKPVTRRQESERGVMKTLVGHRWECGSSALELFYFAAQDPKFFFRTLSLHYKSEAKNLPPPERTGIPSRSFDH